MLIRKHYKLGGFGTLLLAKLISAQSEYSEHFYGVNHQSIFYVVASQNISMGSIFKADSKENNLTSSASARCSKKN